MRKFGRCNRRVQYFYIFALGSLIITFLLINDEIDKYYLNSESTQSKNEVFHYRIPKSSILKSAWIQYFPDIIDMVKKINETDMASMTSANHSKLEILSNSILEIGKTLNAQIIAHSVDGRKKQHGGDFFLVTLHAPGSEYDGISCDVLDNMDGSYNVTCRLMWTGYVMIRALLVHPSETIFNLICKFSSEQERGKMSKVIAVNDRNEKETLQCSVGLPNAKTNSQCKYTNRNGEYRTCFKPSSGICNVTFLWEELITTNRSEFEFFDSYYVHEHVNFLTPIKGSNKVLMIEKAQKVIPMHEMNFSTMNTIPMSPSGWFFNSTWHSFRIEQMSFSQDRLMKCVRDRKIYFIGDSTMRQWYFAVTKFLNATQKFREDPVVWSMQREASISSANASFYYRAHGYPLGNTGPPSSRPYISNTLDEISENSITIFITLGHHFELIHPDVYLKRLLIIKQSILSLLYRYPDTKIFIKGLGYHFPTRYCQSPWLSYRYDVLLRHVFKDMENVTFLEMWDYLTLLGIEDIHPPLKHLLPLLGVAFSALSC